MRKKERQMGYDEAPEIQCPLQSQNPPLRASCARCGKWVSGLGPAPTIRAREQSPKPKTRRNCISASAMQIKQNPLQPPQSWQAESEMTSDFLAKEWKARNLLRA